MKKLLIILLALIAISMSSCIVVTDGPPGPAGYDGNAYFSISYDYYKPYSYWDNNPDVPSKPYFDEYYFTYSDVYDFEYFVNRSDYWYGTYEVWVNRGQAGRPNGIAGRDGLDTYLTLVCNADGPYTERKSAKGENTEVIKLADGGFQYTLTNETGGMKVTLRKTDVSKRKAQTPKVIF